MASTTNQITGGTFQDSEGNPVANGYMTFVLSQDGQVNSSTEVCAGIEIKVLLDADGNIQTSPAQYIWPNDVITPSGTFYMVSVYTENGQLVWGPNAQQVPSTPSPFNVGVWVPAEVNTGTVSSPFQSLTTSGSSGASTLVEGVLNIPVYSGGSGGVSSVFSRTGAVVAATGDYTVSQVTGAAPLASPALTGIPTAPTATSGTNTTQIATTAFVEAAVSGGGLSPDGTTIFDNAGKLSTKSIKIENIFTGAGTQNYVHNLGDMYPIYSCFSKSGATAFTATPIDANTMAISVAAATDMVCSFMATLPEAIDFSYTVTPSTYTYVPTMGGTQTPTFAISQAAIGGYTGTATYSASGLASGMSASYSPTTITGAGSSTLSVSFPATQAAGLTTITTSATDGTHTHTNPLALTISGINTNLVDGWPMEDGSGTTFLPGPATGNNQTFTSGIGTWGSVPGLGSNAFTFNGTGGSIGTNTANTNFQPGDPFSISFWMTLSSTGAYDGLVSNLATGGGFDIGIGSWGRLIYGLQNTSGGTGAIANATSGTFSSGTLYFVVITYNGNMAVSGLTGYVNGAVVAQATQIDTLTSSAITSGAVSLGNTPNEGKHNGALGYVRIYDAALTSAQVSALYAVGPR